MSIVYTPSSKVDLTTLTLLPVSTAAPATLGASAIGSYCLLSGGTGNVIVPPAASFALGQFLVLKNQNSAPNTVVNVTDFTSLAAGGTAVIIKTAAGLISL